MTAITATWTSVLRVTLLLAICLVNEGCSSVAQARLQSSETTSFSVYSLSIGKGVPDATRDAVNRAAELLRQAEKEKKVLRLIETRIGLEGETRWCADFADEASAREFYSRVYELMKGVELVNLQFESCGDR